MKALYEFIVRRSGTISLVLLFLAFLPGVDVFQSVWQGNGLHGYVFHLGKANTNTGTYVSAWTAFFQSLSLLLLSGFFCGIRLWLQRCRRIRPKG